MQCAAVREAGPSMMGTLFARIFGHKSSDDAAANRAKLDEVSQEASCQGERVMKAAEDWDRHESFLRVKLGIGPDRPSFDDLYAPGRD